MVMMIHHRIWVEHELNVDAATCEAEFSVTFTATIGEAKFSFILWPVAESREANLRMKQF